jgi:CRISPR-associated protein Cmr2
MGRDLVTLLKAADSALVAFRIGAVQSFISRSRTVRDLWVSSAIINWLTVQAMDAIYHGDRERAGEKPTFITPWLPEPPLAFLVGGRKYPPSVPNRFLAVVPNDPGAALAKRLAADAVTACRNAWEKLASDVHHRLEKLVSQEIATLEPQLAHGWDRLWDDQVRDFFDIQVATLPLDACDLDTLTRFLGAGWNPQKSEEAVPWGRIELVARLLDAQKLSGRFQAYQAQGHVPQKCTQMASFEQLGPAHEGESRAFWELMSGQDINVEGTRVRKNERLCAVSLVKRYAWVAHLAGRLRFAKARERYFPDTATVAAANWLAEGEPLDPKAVYEEYDYWSGQWLHWSQQDPEKGDDEQSVPDEVWKRILSKRRTQGRAPTYYAILALDADTMNEWLQGVKAPDLGPGFLTRLSGYLTGFARDECRRIVEEQFRGKLIYSAGDDTLGLIPASDALECPQALNQALIARWRGDELLSQAPTILTFSAGIAIMHYKEDLRFAMDKARVAERSAKDRDGDAVELFVARRSGEHVPVFVPWDLMDRVIGTFLQPFRAGASDRWLFALRTEEPTLGQISNVAGAISSEIRRLASRAEEKPGRAGPEEEPAREKVERARVDPEAVVGLWSAYCQATANRPRWPTEHQTSDLGEFLNLCQSVSFLTRAKD